MNIDLVERLRATDDIRPDDGYVADLLEEAADEIEKLREALRDVLVTATGPVNGRNITEETRRAECAVIARAALEKP